MTGTIRLYSHNDNRIRTAFYTTKKHRDEIIDKWLKFYEKQAGPMWENWYIRILPFAYEAKVINMEPEKFVHTEKKVINNPSGEIDMPDFVQIGPFKRETYYHRCYCKGEK